MKKHHTNELFTKTLNLCSVCPKTRNRARWISTELAAAGFTDAYQKAYTDSAVNSILKKARAL